MLCPLCGEPASRIKCRLSPAEKVECGQCGKFKISKRAVLVIRQQYSKLNFEDLVLSAQEKIRDSKKTVLIDSDFIERFRTLPGRANRKTGRARAHPV
jgi:hypothetical protein